MAGLKEILEKYKKGEIDTATAEKMLTESRLVELSNGTVKFDLNREQRAGVPEIVYAESKSPKTCREIAKSILKEKNAVLFTRLTEIHVKELEEFLEENNSTVTGHVHPEWGIASFKRKNHQTLTHGGKVGVITAGTSDVPVAKEAEAVMELMGCEPIAFYDVGIAGLHRIFTPLKKLVVDEDVDAIIVIAGMEGALPSVIAGLVDVPVIGVPSSVGYGYGSKGKAAMASMLQSCSPGLAIVNIDSGFAAGAFAALISMRCSSARKKERK
ncbi:MAG: nickel pincer cofactor biosynthesis protein LarB [Candidatus Hodarchaeales archaeon]